MKCRSVACVWSEGTVPSHRVTATAVLSHPPTLYTGGSDGAIIWWSLSAADSNPEFKPTAMLCGHAAPIAELDVCNPVVVSGGDDKDPSSNEKPKFSSDAYGALISACSDGVMCVWSRGSGHCKRRRKLPPWMGSPSMVRTLQSRPRYVCIACCFVDAVHLSDHNSIDSGEGGDVSVDSDSQNKKGTKCTKCTVVIVDTYTLTVAQTVFHGNLSIGSLKFMAVVSSTKDKEKDLMVVSDSYGRLQRLSIAKNVQEEEGVSGNGLVKSPSQLEMVVWAEGISEKGHVISMAICGNIIAFVLKSHCIFSLLDSGSTIGEISCVDNILYKDDDSTQSLLAGCMFLKSEDARDMLNTEEHHEINEKQFAVWNNRGGLLVYFISYLNDIFTCKLIYEIPIGSRPHDLRLSTSFTQLNHYILRIESLCINAEEPLHWKPLVTLYSQGKKLDNEGNLCFSFTMHGSGSSFVDWTSSGSVYETEGAAGTESDLCSRQFAVTRSKSLKNNCTENGNQTVSKQHVVSSSMVIAETFVAPYAIVYGFFSGEIEVVRFDLLEGLGSHGGSPHHETNSPLSRQKFSGHSGAVLCLAAHDTTGTARGWRFNKLLVSGSMDCTVRIWDLDTGSIISVLHQHVAPVRQIILPPIRTERPWSDCFLSVGEDLSVALVSFETLRAERMFPGHPNYPAKVVWDGVRGYIACLCPTQLGTSDVNDILYLWDVKTGARERVIRGTASHSMFDHFCKGISKSSSSDTILNGNTSVSSLLLPIIEDGSSSNSHASNLENSVSLPGGLVKPHTSQARAISQSDKYAIKCSCPFPGIAALSFELSSLMCHYQKHNTTASDNSKPGNNKVREQVTETSTPHRDSPKHDCHVYGTSNDTTSESNDTISELDWTMSPKERLIRFSLSFLHLWEVDAELDYLLLTDMKLKRPDKFVVASGLQGDKGSLTLAFPHLSAILELWKSSSEFSAMRSLTMVSLAQRMISLSHSTSSVSSALAAFYTRNFAEKFPDIKPPLLQLLVSFWQDESEHVRMAARTLFHCAASRAIPLPLQGQKATSHAKTNYLVGPAENEHGNSNIRLDKTSPNVSCADQLTDTQGASQAEQSYILAWLESFEMQDWISCVGGTSQDTMTSHIIVAAALAIWYPSLVKPCLSMLVVHPLMKLVMAMNEKYSSTAAELLAEGMEGTWKLHIASEIPRLIGDIFFQIECVSGPSAKLATGKSAVPKTIRDTLVRVLLPSLAMADVQAFLNIIDGQVWSTASDSPVHLVALMTLMRVVRGSPKSLAQYLDKVVGFILQTMDPSNSVMRKTCFQTSMTALKEVVHAFPMVALNDTWTRLAVGDIFGEIKSASIRVYDMQSVSKIKVLDASAPPGLPTLLAAVSETVVATAISALSFSPDGEGLVAFSEHGLMIRWWSLGSVWWEKLTRNFVPVQCTKLIFVPPWEGFSPNSSRSSIMGSIMGQDYELNVQDNPKVSSHPDNLKLLIHNLDLSYRLEWVGDRKVLLTRHGHELGTYPL